MNIFNKIDSSSKDIVFIYTICGSKNEARALGYYAIEERLAISIDYWIINSIYPWQGIIQEIDQYMLIFSTQKKLSNRLIKDISLRHSYKVPMIVKCNTDFTNLTYLHWVDKNITDSSKLKTKKDINKKLDPNGLSKLK